VAKKAFPQVLWPFSEQPLGILTRNFTCYQFVFTWQCQSACHLYLTTTTFLFNFSGCLILPLPTACCTTNAQQIEVSGVWAPLTSISCGFVVQHAVQQVESLQQIHHKLYNTPYNKSKVYSKSTTSCTTRRTTSRKSTANPPQVVQQTGRPTTDPHHPDMSGCCTTCCTTCCPTNPQQVEASGVWADEPVAGVEKFRCSPVELVVVGRSGVETWTVLRVELSVPATMTLHEWIFPWFHVQWTTDVALVVPDHQISLHLTQTNTRTFALENYRNTHTTTNHNHHHHHWLFCPLELRLCLIFLALYPLSVCWKIKIWIFQLV